MAARITIALDEDVRAKLQAEMRNTGMSSEEIVNEALRVGLLSRQATSKVKLYTVLAKNLGLEPGYSFDKPWELIEELEGPDYR